MNMIWGEKKEEENKEKKDVRMNEAKITAFYYLMVKIIDVHIRSF